MSSDSSVNRSATNSNDSSPSKELSESKQEWVSVVESKSSSLNSEMDMEVTAVAGGDATEDEKSEVENDTKSTFSKTSCESVADNSAIKKPATQKRKVLLARAKAAPAENESDDDAPIEASINDLNISEKNLNNHDLHESGMWEHDEFAKNVFEQGLSVAEEYQNANYSLSKAKDRKDNKKKLSQPSRTRRVRTPRAKARCTFDTDSEKNGEDVTESERSGADETEDDDVQEKKARKPRTRRIYIPSEDGERPKIKRNRQPASALMVDKALKTDSSARKLRVDNDAKERLKLICYEFIGGLLGRPELSCTFSETAIKKVTRFKISTCDTF
eukprot:69729-Hanusia_phi.AAC.2